MEKIKMTTPLVEMDGDEMAAILWKETKEKLILPFVDLMVEYYNLSIRNRDFTDRFRQCRQQIRCCRQMRHHHAKPGAHAGISVEKNVEEPERYHPLHHGRYRVPCADSDQRH